ncbi:hypothetical protein BV011_00169A, partial [Haemophilus influenzae]
MFSEKLSVFNGPLTNTLFVAPISILPASDLIPPIVASLLETVTPVFPITSLGAFWINVSVAVTLTLLVNAVTFPLRVMFLPDKTASPIVAITVALFSRFKCSAASKLTLLPITSTSSLILISFAEIIFT